MLQVREPDLSRTEAELARHGLAQFARRDRHGRTGRAHPHCRGRSRAGRRGTARAARRLVRDHLAHAEAARRAGLRGRGTRRAPRCRRPGSRLAPDFDPDQDVAAPYIATGRRPRVAILREQGVNSQVEMAAAFDRAGFTAVDVHMTDLIDRGATLEGFQGLVACGGFSYGDVLGAGEGWAKSILFNPRVRGLFEGWFAQDGPVHARRVQRLPDVGRPRRTHSRCGALAALPPQPVRAVRGPAFDG